MNNSSISPPEQHEPSLAPQQHDIHEDAIRRLIRQLANDYNIIPTQILSKDRHMHVALCRQVCMTLLYWHTSLSNAKVAEIFNGHYSNVMHARKTIAAHMHVDSKFKKYICSLEKNILNRTPNHRRRNK